MLEFLPDNVLKALKNYDASKLCEIRLRVDKPSFALVGGKSVKLPCDNFTRDDMERLILKLTKHSIYAFSDEIKNGYLYGDFGERVGLCGECVTDGGQVRTVKEFSSVCVRVPKQIIGCAEFLFGKVFASGIKNLLVISPPGAGKTTVLRDIARCATTKFGLNVLVVDEKREIFGENFDLGDSCDVLSGCPKEYGFFVGVKNLCPDVIICDELSSESDVSGAVSAALSGVKVIASAHGESVEDLKRKSVFLPLLSSGVMDYAVVLSKRLGAGTVESVEKL